MKKLFSLIITVVIVMMAVIPASAASDSFVPSIDAKEGPVIIIQTDSKGNQVGSIIYDKDGHEVIGVPADAIIITPVAGISDAEAAIKEALEYAKNQIVGAATLADLTDEVNEYLKKNYPEIDLEDLSVSQLFDIRLNDEYSNYLVDGAYFNVKLDLGESFLFFLIAQNQNWVLGKDYTIDGTTITINLTGASQLAFVKANASSSVPADKNNADVVSPQTGNYTEVLFITLGVLFAVGAVLLATMFVKNRAKTTNGK